MSQRSTRNKLRWQLKKAADKAELILLHLQFADELAEGTSPDLIEHLPAIVAAVEAVRKTILDFRAAI